MAHILRRAKLLAPDRVPQPSREATDAWVDAFLRYHAFPPQLWAEAVDWWAANRANERMLNPQSLREAVYAVRDRWESDPQRREVLQRSRQQRLGSRVDRGELPGGGGWRFGEETPRIGREKEDVLGRRCLWALRINGNVVFRQFYPCLV